jgi:hypothetical protein
MHPTVVNGTGFTCGFSVSADQIHCPTLAVPTVPAQPASGVSDAPVMPLPA